MSAYFASRIRAALPVTASAGLALVSLAVAWPRELTHWRSLTYPALVAAFAAVALYLCLRRRQPLVGLIVVLFVCAYSPGLGDAVTRGLAQKHVVLVADPGSVRSAVWMFVLFLGLVVAASGPAARGWEALLPRARAEPEHVRRALARGMALFLGVCFAISLATGTWTAYGGAASDVSRNGAFRFELLYGPMLFTCFGIAVSSLLDGYDQERPRLRRALVAICVGLFAMMFMLQVRRLMIGSVLLGVVLALNRPRVAGRIMRSPFRLASVAAGLVAVGAIVAFGSNAWRTSAQEFQTNSIGERLSDTASKLETSEQGTLEKDRERLTYLWLDACSIKVAPQVDGILTLGDLFTNSVANATPGMIYPDKYKEIPETCEMAYETVGVNIDLPCTAQTEGYLAAGMPGVLFLALTWAIVLGLSEVLFRRRTILAQLTALQLLAPLTVVETDAFPTIHALRCALIALGATIVFAAGFLLLASPGLKTAHGTHWQAPL